MQAEQAIFTSARTSRHQGYQVVARSPGLLDGLADFLARWGPTHGSLPSRDVHAESINFTTINSDYFLVSRTFFGGPEYSARGALQVVTRFLVAQRAQLKGYHNNPITLARTAMLLGHLWLPGTLRAGAELPPIALPDRPPRHLLEEPARPGDARAVTRCIDTLKSERVALIGTDDPVAAVDEILRQTGMEERLDLSFTTGLVPSRHRRFRLHMLPRLDAEMRDRLQHQGIRALMTSAECAC